MTNNLAAETIAEDLLYRTGRAIVDRDFAAFNACMSFPFLIETGDGRRLVENKVEGEAVFWSVRSYCDDQEVVDIIRTVLSSEFIDNDTIGSTHVSLMKRRAGLPERSPYPVYSIIRRFGAEWLLVSSLYAILDSPEHNAALMRDLVANAK